jgi:hypothetical protein
MKTLRSILVAAVLMASASAALAGWHRQVVVNGVRLSPAQLATLDGMHCTRIPNGAYWLNTRTGAWGYAGNPWRQGFLGDPCRLSGNGRHRSLSERGLLYTPGDLNFR